MKNIIYVISIILLLSGCATNYQPGEMSDDYSPYSFNLEADKPVVVVKAAKGTRFWEVDGKRIASIPSMMFGGGYDSIKVNAGVHSFSASRGRDMNIGNVNLLEDHEYYLNHLKADDRIYYWLEDITTKKVIYGRKQTIEMLEAK